MGTTSTRRTLVGEGENALLTRFSIRWAVYSLTRLIMPRVGTVQFTRVNTLVVPTIRRPGETIMSFPTPQRSIGGICLQLFENGRPVSLAVHSASRGIIRSCRLELGTGPEASRPRVLFPWHIQAALLNTFSPQIQPSIGSMRASLMAASQRN